MISRLFSLTALLLISLGEAAFAEDTSTRPPDPASHPPAGHSREEETARIRVQHLKRTHDRLTAEPGSLHESCRYESEIATSPPVRKVALTFDDGPEPGQTEFILEILQKHDVPAAFFMIGNKAKAHPALVARVRSFPQLTIGNHSWDHPNFHDIPPAEQAGEILQNDELLSGSPAPKLFRYPYGNSSCESNALLRAHTYKIVGWHVDTCDWAFDRSGMVDDKEALSCGVLAQNRKNFVEHVVASVRAHDGGIVLLHEIHPNTLRQLEEIIIRLKKEGFVFTDIRDDGFESSMR